MDEQDASMRAAIRDAVAMLDERGEQLILRARLETSIRGLLYGSYFYEVTGHVYDFDRESELPAGDQVASASVIIRPDGYDPLAAYQDLAEDSDELSAPFDKLSDEKVRPVRGWDPRRPELLLITDLSVNHPWGGNRVSVHFVNAICDHLGRNASVALIDLDASYDLDYESIDAEEPGPGLPPGLVNLAESAGFQRLGRTTVFGRALTEDVILNPASAGGDGSLR